MNVDFDDSSDLSSFFKGGYSVNDDLTPAGSSWKVYKKGTKSNDETACMWLVESIKTWALGLCNSVGGTAAYVAFFHIFFVTLKYNAQECFPNERHPG